MFVGQNFKQVRKEKNPIANIRNFMPTSWRLTQVREEKKLEKRKKTYSKRPLKLHVYKLKLHIGYIPKNVYYTYLVICI